MFQSSINCYGLGCGMNLLFYKRPKNPPSLPIFDSQFNKWLCKTTFQHQVFCFWMIFFFHFFLNMLLLISLLFLQLEIEELKLFDATILDFSLVIREVLDIIFFSSYIQQWRLAIWETSFFWEFKPKHGIQKNKSLEQQLKSKEDFKQVLYMYFNYTTSFHFQAIAN